MMTSLKQQLTDIVTAVFVAHGYAPSYGETNPSQRRELADFQCNGALAAAKQYQKNPRQMAQEIADGLQDNPIFAEVSLAGPGFLNLRLTDSFLAETVQMMRADESGRLGVDTAVNPLTVIVDYGGPNVAKPLHVGHLRAPIIGESLKRTSRFLGHHTLGDVHLGDWGLQMGQLIIELQDRHPDWLYFDAGYTGPYPAESPITIQELEEIYPAASARCKADPIAMEAARQATTELQNKRPGYYALWRQFVNISVADLKQNYDKLNIQFDLWLGESDVQDLIPDMVADLQARQIAEPSDGALIINVAEETDKKELPPLMLVMSSGAVGYGTTDLATIVQRVRDYDPDLILYVVDGRQQLHFRQVFRAAYRAGIANPAKLGLEHNYFGTVNGTDGKPFKTRAGGVMKLEDLIGMMIAEAYRRLDEIGAGENYPAEEKADIAHKVGVSALKFADLVNHRTGDYVFDLERFSSFEGRTGPYLLYTAVRTRSILRKAAEQNLHPGQILPSASPAERELQLKFTELPDVIQYAFDTRAPNHLCEYGYTLAMQFNRFYREHHILKESDPAQQASWLAICDLTVKTMELVLELLGIAVPERM
jgi:arginyl-tRNA synthetase